MKTTLNVCMAIILLCAFRADWETNLEKAKMKAAREHKYILLNFSGSDWCGPCIRLKETLFSSTAFVQFADSSLVLLNADFPRQKKNRLTAQQQQLNNQLADQYNPSGNFPMTILLNAEGKPVKEWIGIPKEDGFGFITEINTIIHGK
ncbi:thioredoxin family protein [Filimonas lacunae]|nr:thioredoxin family protein [Filimonas lacunae]